MFEDAITVLVAFKGHNGTSRTEEQLEAKSQNLYNMVIGKKLRTFKFENCHLLKIENIALSPRQVSGMRQPTWIANISSPWWRQSWRQRPRRQWKSNQKEMVVTVNLSRPLTVPSHSLHHRVTDPRRTSPRNGKQVVVLGKVRKPHSRATITKLSSS